MTVKKERDILWEWCQVLCKGIRRANAEKDEAVATAASTQQAGLDQAV